MSEAAGIAAAVYLVYLAPLAGLTVWVILDAIATLKDWSDAARDTVFALILTAGIYV